MPENFDLILFAPFYAPSGKGIGADTVRFLNFFQQMLLHTKFAFMVG